MLALSVAWSVASEGAGPSRFGPGHRCLQPHEGAKIPSQILALEPERRIKPTVHFGYTVGVDMTRFSLTIYICMCFTIGAFEINTADRAADGL